MFYLLVGTDEGSEADDATVSEELSGLRDTTDVLLSVVGGESQVLVETVTEVVSIQTGRQWVNCGRKGLI